MHTCGKKVSPLRRRPKGFAVALWKPSLPLRMEGVVNATEDNVADFLSKQPLGCCEGVQRAIAKPSARVRRRGILSDAAAVSRRLRVAARLSRAVTPANGNPKFQPTRMGVERAEGPSRGFQRGSAPLAGSKGSALGGLSGQRPDRESRGQRPLAGPRAKAPGRVKLPGAIGPREHVGRALSGGFPPSRSTPQCRLP